MEFFPILKQIIDKDINESLTLQVLKILQLWQTAFQYKPHATSVQNLPPKKLGQQAKNPQHNKETNKNQQKQTNKKPTKKFI